MRLKKTLGQNFLRDKNVLARIISAADLKTDDNAIEIGPGEGILTEELAKRAGKTIAVEIDNDLAGKLKKKYENNRRIEIINGDILKINLSEIISKNNFKNYKVIANIPYYITSLIVKLFLETENPPKEMILMVQKEVAERICAPVGKMSILAVSVQYYARPELLFFVDKKSFWPVPKVDSAVIKISNIKNQKSKLEIKNFFRIVRAGFSARRKTILNNFSNSLHLDRKTTEEKIKKAGLIPTQRAQELSMEDWKKLTKVFTD
jgi:16S rRNA (adenine1518-N6/adenine1519-N6)-dimethyltransferase